MVIEYVREGSIVNTADGFIECANFNGSIVYCTEYETDIDGYKTGKSCARMLTLYEIGLLMKEQDGNNHKLAWCD